MSETAIETPAAETALVGPDFEKKVLETFEADFAPHLRNKLAEYTRIAEVTRELKVTDRESLAVVDTWNKALLRELDALEKVRASGPGALNRLGLKMGKAFKPLKDLLEAQSANLKHEMGAYLLAEKRKQEETYKAAAAAHVAGDHAAAQQALVVASEADTAVPVGNSLREVWVVERFELPRMVLSTPDHPGLVPDQKAIDAYLAKLPAGEEPALPGVICKKVPAMTTRRNG